MRTWRRAVIAVVLVATALLFYRWWQSASARAERRPHGAGNPEQTEPSASRPSQSAGASPREQGGGSVHGDDSPKLDRARADRMREELRALLAEAGALGLMGAASAEPAGARDAGFATMPTLGSWDGGGARVDPDYIRTRVHEDLFPLARDCYADALKRKPALSGKLVVWFRIIGDRKVGGVVDEARLTDETTLDDAEMQTCVRESMMAVSFDAPPEDREITVIYPIVFSPEDDQDAGSQ
jgi:hypothetical protein